MCSKIKKQTKWRNGLICLRYIAICDIAVFVIFNDCVSSADFNFLILYSLSNFNNSIGMVCCNILWRKESVKNNDWIIQDKKHVLPKFCNPIGVSPWPTTLETEDKDIITN